MQKKLVLLISITLIYITGFSQVLQVLEAIKPQKSFDGTPVLVKGSQVIQIGIGIPNNAANLLDFGGIVSLLNGAGGVKKGVGPIFINYEYELNETMGIGIGLAHVSAEQTFNSSAILPVLGINAKDVTGKIKLYQIAVNSTYHIYTTDKLDPYFKAAIGINFWKGSYTDETGKPIKPFTTPTPFGYQGLVGMRYFVKPKFAFIGELSFSNLKFTVNIGTAFKLK